MAVQLVEPDGAVSSGAEAVFRALASAPGQEWLLRWYRRSALFARVSEAVYQFVARNRGFFSRLTR
jgi:lipase maturation factor 1